MKLINKMNMDTKSINEFWKRYKFERDQPTVV
ncbi:MAG: hypothetical protein Dasosvirus1_4 [Dasosvirus sp.]|uniref:Uncharacterized protein n=1 Tax=Dasosvirus sp. TaxID=2487764 RepID=A0A3G4ZVA7_9VIRU|nr:MAG: hypothetical protein Dasosvirus1_4 [Dasosvirus sp.]